MYVFIIIKHETKKIKPYICAKAQIKWSVLSTQAQDTDTQMKVRSKSILLHIASYPMFMATLLTTLMLFLKV